MADVFSLTIKDEVTIRDDILRAIRNGLIAIGVPNPNVSRGSDYWILATAIAGELAVAQSNAPVLADEAMPDTASYDGLVRWARILGRPVKPATSSLGAVVLDAASPSVVIVGTQLLSAEGTRYQVTIGGHYGDGALIPVESVDTGPDTEVATGATLRWVSAPPFAAETALVAAPGLKGGAAAESTESLRARVLAQLANPPGGGNWQHVAQLAEDAHPTVQKAFIYPALQGPATLHFAVVAAATAKNRNRNVPASTVTNVVAPTVIGLLIEHSAILGTSVTDVAVDVAIGLSLPAAPTASPPGPGGGWLDATPWPTRSNVGYVKVESTPAATTFQVTADRPPIEGVTRIAWLSPNDWQLYTATVVQAEVKGGGYQVTIDTPFPDLAAGHFIWPQAAQQQAYVDAFLDAFGAMGPGEKSDNPTALERGFRHPLPSLAWPASLNATQLRSISDAGDEVLDASYLYRSITTPPLPAAVSDPPSILVPRNIAFYPL